MSPIVIRPVRTKADRKLFIEIQWMLNQHQPAWVPPLRMDRWKLTDREKNPFYKHADTEFYIAERGGAPVGRIGAIVNHNHNREHDESMGFFGFFESVDDRAVAHALLDAARAFVKAHGATQFRGPVTPSVNDEYGLLVEGFDKTPAVLMAYNPPYYGGLLEGYGLTKVKDLLAFLMDQETVYSDRLDRANRLVRERHGIELRPIDMKRFREDVELLKEVYNRAWSKNWGAVPMTDDEMDALAADLKPVIVPDLVLYAFKQGKVVGFALSLPDINQALRFNRSGGLVTGLWHLWMKKKHIDTVRIIALGTLPEFVNTGAAGVLFYETAVRAKRLGYRYGEASWVLEDNLPMVKSAGALNGVISKRYRLYQMPVT
ncbi:MAG: hypothetical protein MUE68_10310 [Bacteroidetes bacterium]|jgi:GNAT superfamily N-acetyltransferase|nr:hypothetical protein [Bacteroidota bacterium]